MISGPCLLNLVCFGRLNKPTAASHAHACILPCLAISSFVLLFSFGRKTSHRFGQNSKNLTCGDVVEKYEYWEWKLAAKKKRTKERFSYLVFFSFPITNIENILKSRYKYLKGKIKIYFCWKISKVSFYITFQYLDLRFIFKCFWRSVLFN